MYNLKKCFLTKTYEGCSYLHCDNIVLSAVWRTGWLVGARLNTEKQEMIVNHSIEE